VEALEIRIRNVEFPGATPDQFGRPFRQRAPKAHRVHVYMALRPLAQVASIEFIPVCLQRGYLKSGVRRFQAPRSNASRRRSGSRRNPAIKPPGKGVFHISGGSGKGNTVIRRGGICSGLIRLPIGQPR